MDKENTPPYPEMETSNQGQTDSSPFNGEMNFLLKHYEEIWDYAQDWIINEAHGDEANTTTASYPEISLPEIDWDEEHLERARMAENQDYGSESPLIQGGKTTWQQCYNEHIKNQKKIYQQHKTTQTDDLENKLMGTLVYRNQQQTSRGREYHFRSEWEEEGTGQMYEVIGKLRKISEPTLQPSIPTLTRQQAQQPEKTLRQIKWMTIEEPSPPLPVPSRTVTNIHNTDNHGQIWEASPLTEEEVEDSHMDFRTVLNQQHYNQEPRYRRNRGPETIVTDTMDTNNNTAKTRDEYQVSEIFGRNIPQTTNTVEDQLTYIDKEKINYINLTDTEVPIPRQQKDKNPGKNQARHKGRFRKQKAFKPPRTVPASATGASTKTTSYLELNEQDLLRSKATSTAEAGMSDITNFQLTRQLDDINRSGGICEPGNKVHDKLVNWMKHRQEKHRTVRETRSVATQFPSRTQNRETGEIFKLPEKPAPLKHKRRRVDLKKWVWH